MKHLLPFLLLLSIKLFGQGNFDNGVLLLHADRSAVWDVMQKIESDFNLDEVTKIAEQLIEKNPTDIRNYLPKALLIAHLQGINHAYAFLDRLDKAYFTKEILLYAKIRVAVKYEHESAANAYVYLLRKQFPNSKYLLEILHEDYLYVGEYEDFGITLDSFIQAETNVSDKSYLRLIKAAHSVKSEDATLGKSIIKDIWKEHPEHIDPLMFYNWLNKNSRDGKLKSQVRERLDFSESYTYLSMLLNGSDIWDSEKGIIKLIRLAADTNPSDQSIRNIIGPYVFANLDELSEKDFAKFNFTSSEERVYTLPKKEMLKILTCMNFYLPKKECPSVLDSLARVYTPEEREMIDEMLISKKIIAYSSWVTPMTTVYGDKHINFFMNDIDTLRLELLRNPIRSFNPYLYKNVPFEQLLPILDEVCEKYPGAKYVFDYRQNVMRRAIREEKIEPNTENYKKLVLYYIEAYAVRPSIMKEEVVSFAMKKCGCKDEVETPLNELIKQYPYNQSLIRVRETGSVRAK